MFKEAANGLLKCKILNLNSIVGLNIDIIHYFILKTLNAGSKGLLKCSSK